MYAGVPKRTRLSYSDLLFHNGKTFTSKILYLSLRIKKVNICVQSKYLGYACLINSRQLCKIENLFADKYLTNRIGEIDNQGVTGEAAYRSPSIVRIGDVMGLGFGEGDRKRKNRDPAWINLADMKDEEVTTDKSGLDIQGTFVSIQ